MNLNNLVDFCREMGYPDPFSGAHVPAPLNLDTVKSAIMIRCGLQTPVYIDPYTFTQTVTHWFNTKQWTFEHLIKVIQSEYDPIENVFEYRSEKTVYGHTEQNKGTSTDKNSGKDVETESGTDQRDISESGTDQRDISESGTDQRDISESGTDQRDISESGTDQRDIRDGGTDTTTNTISAFNSPAYQPDNQSSTLYGKTTDDDITYGKKTDDDVTYGKTVDDDITYGKKTDDDVTYGKKVDDDITYGKQTDTAYGRRLDHTDETLLTHGGADELIMNRHGNIGVTSVNELINQELDMLRRFDVYAYIAELFESDNMIMVY